MTSGPTTDAGSRTGSRLEAILDERTRRLAGDAGAGDARPDLPGVGPVLVCALGPERYGIRIDQVAQVLAMPELLPVPGAPRGLLGLFSRNGQVAGVIDLAAALGVEGRTDADADHHLVLLRRPPPLVALKVDATLGIATARTLAAGIDPAKQAAGGPVIAYGSAAPGTVAPDETLFGLLDPDAIVRPFLPSRSPESDRHVDVDR